MIAGAGFAMMAWRLAQSRSPMQPNRIEYYATREHVARTSPGSYPVHREYYRIIDNAAERWPDCFCMRVRL